MELFVAAIVSLVVEGIKRVFSTNVWGTHLALLAVSFAAAALYAYLQATGLWDKFLPIAIQAAGIWAILNGTFKKQGS